MTREEAARLDRMEQQLTAVTGLMTALIGMIKEVGGKSQEPPPPPAGGRHLRLVVDWQATP